MDNQVPYTPTSTPETQYQAPAAPAKKYSSVDCLFAWLSLAVGYVFCRVHPVNDNPLGGLLFVFALFITTAIILKCKGFTLGVMPTTAAISALVVSSSLFICANSFLNSLAYLYTLVIYCYFIYAVTGNSLKRGFADLILVDFFKALFILPFCSLGNVYKALFSGKKGGIFSLKVLLGIVIAIVPTTIVVSLLSYDSGFSELLSETLNLNFSNIFSHIGSLILGVPIAMYVFGLYASSIENKCNSLITEESCSKASTGMKFVPITTMVAATIPILFVYVIFFISQWKYYISGFTGVLPEDFSYAEYAREGFFQLCTVSVINLVVIVVVMLFMRRNRGSSPAALKLLSVIYALFTLILISTAVAKMVMYIDYYGLTQKRVYATWMMVLLALIFVLVAIKQFVTKFNVVAASLAVCVVLFAGLSMSNVDAFIAKYNVDRYLNGTLETVDLDSMNDLGDAAIPELVRLVDELEVKMDTDFEYEQYELYEDLFSRLKTKAAFIGSENENIFSTNIPSIKAKDALKDW